ncbi:MAG: hypothetical protein QOE70_960 [Chthoniobacter sp.]|jgi:hypothetical protein|nr:hypothetical protein [Chthoniobacter sp.]
MLGAQLADLKGRQPDGGSHTREVKLGCVFSQTATDGRRALTSPAPSRSATSTTPASTPGSWRARSAVPAPRGQRAAKLLLPPDEATKRAIIKEARRLAAESHQRLDIAEHETIERGIDYFETNFARTRYGHFRAAGFFIASGVVEADAKLRWAAASMPWDVLERTRLLGPHFEGAWRAAAPSAVKSRRCSLPERTFLPAPRSRGQAKKKYLREAANRASCPPRRLSLGAWIRARLVTTSQPAGRGNLSQHIRIHMENIPRSRVNASIHSLVTLRGVHRAPGSPIPSLHCSAGLDQPSVPSLEANNADAAVAHNRYSTLAPIVSYWTQRGDMASTWNGIPPGVPSLDLIQHTPLPCLQ